MLLALTLMNLGSVLVIPIIVIMAVYMFAYATQNQSLIALARSEISDYIIFLVLFAVLSSFVFSDFANDLLGFTANYVHEKLSSSSSNPYSKPASGSSHSALITSALNSLDSNRGILNDILNNHSQYLRKISILSSISHTVSFLSATSAEGIKNKEIADKIKTEVPSADAQVTFSSCSGYSSVVNVMSGLASYLGMAIMAIKFQELLIEVLSSDIAVNALLAIGILLRANPITRNAGAFFLALGLGLYYIMPFSILIANDAVYSYYHEVKGIGNAIQSFYADIDTGYNDLTGTAFICYPGKIRSYLSSLENQIKGDNANMISSFIFFVILAQGITLLTFVSIVGGISKVFGAEIGPYIIGRLTVYLSGR